MFFWLYIPHLLIRLSIQFQLFQYSRPFSKKDIDSARKKKCKKFRIKVGIKIRMALVKMLFLFCIYSDIKIAEGYSSHTYHAANGGLTEVPSDIPWYTTKIKLSKNYITRIPANVFSHLNVCDFMNLHDNRISFIEKAGFSGMISLRDLRLGQNMLSSILPGWFLFHFKSQGYSVLYLAFKLQLRKW